MSSSTLTIGILLKDSLERSILGVLRQRIKSHLNTNREVELKVMNKKSFLSDIDNIEVLLADPYLCGNHLLTMPKNIKWIQSLWAGQDGVFQNIDRKALENFQPHFYLTRMGDVMNIVMADYVLGAIVALERDFKSQILAQINKKWLTETDAPSVFSYRPLSSLTVGVLGAGNIGLKVAEQLNKLGMKVIALKRRSVTKEELCKYSDFEKVYTTEKLSEFLFSCDYICNVLPHTSHTTDLLSGEVLSACKSRCPGFINIGRGSIISEDSLLKALSHRWISGAFLDVFNSEPLPPTSLLWQVDNVTITHHTAGLLVQKELIVKLFVENLQLYENGQELRYAYNWSQGY